MCVKNVCHRGFLLIALLTVVAMASGQRVVIIEDVREQRDERDYGMNRRHYTHSWLSLQFVTPVASEAGADLLYGRSRSMEFGYRYKLRFSDVFSAGGDLALRRTAFQLRQNGDKMVPGIETFDREKLVFLHLGAGLYQRVNVGVRGDYIGRFLDVGAYGGWNFHTRHVTHHESEEGERIRTRRSGLDYPAALEYGLMARVGFGNFVLKGKYRMSDIFKDEAELPELPRLFIGMELGLHPF